MAGPLDIDDDLPRMVLRKGKATAKGGHAFQRLLQLAETRRAPEQRPGPARRAVHRGDLQRQGFPLRSVRAARRRTLPSATTCSFASTDCAGASLPCTASCQTATGGEFGEGRAVIDRWGLKWPEAQ